MDVINETLDWLWNHDVIRVGDAHISFGMLLAIVVSIALMLTVLSWIRKLVLRRLRKRLGDDIGALYSVSVIVQYIIGTVAFFAIIQAAGINLSSLTVVFGALGVGVGFGLQNIVNNFVSGIVILLERPIKVGDRIEVGNLEGDITDISIRATTVVTNEGVAVIVPNSQFISQQVINRSLQDRNIRFRIPVGVAYDSDPAEVKRVLLEVAHTYHGVLKNPEPMVIFQEFGSSSLDFFLWVWTSEYINKPNIFRSEMNFAIHAALKEANIIVAYPQRDIHFGKEPLTVHLKKDS